MGDSAIRAARRLSRPTDQSDEEKAWLMATATDVSPRYHGSTSDESRQHECEATKMNDFWRAIIVTFWDMYTSAYTVTFLYAYLPEMTLWLGYSEEEKGYTVGYIASSFAIGAFIANYPLGWLSDRYGQRITLIILLIANALFCTGFAFSNTLWMMVLFRFLAGMCNSIFPICRAVIGLYSYQGNQTLAMASNQTAWALGLVLGSALGGYLASPATKYTDTFPQEGFFTTFPYVLPPTLGCAFSVIGAFLTSFLYPKEVIRRTDDADTPTDKRASNIDVEKHTDVKQVETEFTETDTPTSSTKHATDVGIPTNKHTANIDVENHADVKHVETEFNKTYEPTTKQATGIDVESHTSTSTDLEQVRTEITENSTDIAQVDNENKLNNEHDDETPKKTKKHIQRQNTVTEDTDKNINKSNTQNTVIRVTKFKREVSTIDEQTKNVKSCMEAVKNSTIMKLLRNNNFTRASIVYSLISSVLVTYVEMYSVWASTVTDLGGVAYSTNDIGLVLTIVIVPSAILQLCLLPLLERCLGTVRSCVFFMCMSMIAISVTSQSRLVGDSTVQWATILVAQFFVHIGDVASSSTILVVLNNCVEKSQVGSANGLVQMASSVGKFLGPILGGVIFSTSISSNFGIPLDYNLVFVILGSLLWCNCIIAYGLPWYLNRSTPTDDVET